jgi:hypothetical protein
MGPARNRGAVEKEQELDELEASVVSDKVGEKKLPERVRKIPSKLTGCQCSLVVKQYPNTTKLLGMYYDQHNHPLNATNLPFTRIPKETREFIAGRLRDRMSADAVVCTPSIALKFN